MDKIRLFIPKKPDFRHYMYFQVLNAIFLFFKANTIHMQKIKPVYHFFFWVFVYFFIFDVVEYENDLPASIVFSFIEVAIYSFIFYINLHFLIPALLESRGKVFYISGLLLLFVLLLILIFLVGLWYYFADNDLRVIFTFGLNYFLFIVISFLYWYLTLYQRERNNRLILENEKLQAELLFLKSQVSPHFLFNSLNNIYSLSVVKHDNAPVMIEKLSDILRYIIYEGRNKEVYLKREVELMNNYIDLQLLKKLKAEKNIKVSIKGVKVFHKIAPLILINLIENCFKHSNIAYNKAGFLTIELIVEDDKLFFKTANSYEQSSKQEGIGIKNIKKQLSHYYPESHLLKIENNGSVFKVDLQINMG